MTTDAAALDEDRIARAEGGIWISISRVAKLLARSELAHHRGTIALAVLMTLIASVLAVFAPMLLGEAINKVVPQEGQAARYDVAAQWLFLGLGLTFLSAALPQMRDWVFAPVAQAAQRVAAVDAFRHAQALSLNFHQTRRTGALNRIIERGAGAIDYLIRFLAFNIGPTLIRLVIAAAALGIAYDLRLSLIAVVTIIAYVAATVAITEWRVRQRRTMNEADTSLRAISVDILANFETVKAFAAEERETRRYDKALGDYNLHYVVNVRSMYFLNMVQSLVMNLGLLAVMLLSAWNVIQGRMQVGDLTAVMLVLQALYQPLNILGWAWREIKQGTVDLEKLHGLLQTVPDIADRPDARDLARPHGHVAFEQVSFAHQGRVAGIESISFDVPAGKSVAFVGASGAGKSTLLKLLFRFYDVDDGAVKIDGQDVRDVSQDSLRRWLGLVPQDVVLFNDTLRANIAFARPEASDADIRDAARKAQILDFIESLPQGWLTKVGERGLKLSGGERQRVGIARVLLADPAVLVLDEATSALDSVTESAIQTALEAASEGRTTLMVAHRLSTIRHADEIIVLDAGKIAERGSHDALLAKGGKYADMWQRQAEERAMAAE